MWKNFVGNQGQVRHNIIRTLLRRIHWKKYLVKPLHSRFPITRSSSIGDLSASRARGVPPISYLLLLAVMRIIWCVKSVCQWCHVNNCMYIVKKRIIVYYVPRRIMRVITRRATMLARDRSQGVVETKPRRDQFCEHCRESRNFPNRVHWHVLYFMWLLCVYEFLCVHSNLI